MLTSGTVVVEPTTVVVVNVGVIVGAGVGGSDPGSVPGRAGSASEVSIVVVGTMAVGVSVTWSRTLPTAATATKTAVVVTASQTRA